MADKTTSQETDLGAIDGTELVRVAKGGQNFKTTLADIAAYSGGGGGAGTLAQTLAAGNVTGAYDISVNNNQGVLFGFGGGLGITAKSLTSVGMKLVGFNSAMEVTLDDNNNQIQIDGPAHDIALGINTPPQAGVALAVGGLPVVGEYVL